MTDPTAFPHVPDPAPDPADPAEERDDEFLSTGDGRFRIGFTKLDGTWVEFLTRRMRIGALWTVAERLAQIEALEDAEDLELTEANKAAVAAADEAGLPPRITTKGQILPRSDPAVSASVRRRREERVARFLLEEALPLCTAKGVLDGIEVGDLPSWWPSMLGPLNDGWRHLPTLPGSG